VGPGDPVTRSDPLKTASMQSLIIRLRGKPKTYSLKGSFKRMTMGFNQSVDNTPIKPNNQKRFAVGFLSYKNRGWVFWCKVVSVKVGKGHGLGGKGIQEDRPKDDTKNFLGRPFAN